MRSTILTLALALASTASAQANNPEGWTLNQCIGYARENNIQVQQAMITKENSDEELLQAKAQALPTLSASSGQTVSFSKVQDTEGDYNLKGAYNGNYGLNSSMTLYNGGRLKNNLELQKIYNDAYAYDILDQQNDIEIAVTQAYLNILYAKETVTTAENTLQASQAQKERAEEMYNDGAISLSEYAQFESQYSADNYSLVNAKNNLQQYILNLKQLLELGLDEEFNVSFPDLDDNDVMKLVPSVEEVYNTAIEVMPDMQASRLDIQAAELNEKIAKASGLPSISASASLGTANASGSNYFNQLSNRVNGSAGITLSIPIVNGRSTRTTVAKAKNSTRQTELSYQSAQKNLLSTIESLHQDAVGAQSRYQAAKTKLSSAELSYNLTCEKFNEGMVNAVEMLTEKNTYTAAQQELNQSKYQAILSTALLTFYMDQPIEL